MAEFDFHARGWLYYDLDDMILEQHTFPFLAGAVFNI
jgi:hypothetical protein